MKHKAITVTACDCAFNFESFLVWPSYYYSIIYTVSLLLLLWLCVSDHECSQHHASFHVHVYFYVISGNKDWLIDWLIYLLIDRLIDWLIDWLTGWLADWLTDWLTDWLIDWLTDWLTDWLIDWLAESCWLPDLLTDGTFLVSLGGCSSDGTNRNASGRDAIRGPATHRMESRTTTRPSTSKTTPSTSTKNRDTAWLADHVGIGSHAPF